MNFRAVVNVLGKILLVEAGLLCVPLILSFIYSEGIFLSYIIPMAGLIAIGAPTLFLKKKDTDTFHEKEGLVLVSLAWIAISLVGALPFVISKSIPNYIDAFFETVSGFTTTGASVLGDVESLPKSILFWRSFTHWIGGMGILVFVLAILPDYNKGSMHILRAESPGPTVGKFVSKMKVTARILYAIYIVLTIVLVIFLVCGKMPLFDSIINAFGTAGTGGFSIKNNSIAGYNSTYAEMVIAIFCVIFSINFNVYYFILIGDVLKAFKSEEMLTYLSIIVLATFAIAINIMDLYADFGQAMRYSFFQVSSLVSSTGFITADYDMWPTFSKTILMMLMFMGACAGSTGGGLKVARVNILAKSSYADLKKIIKPRSVMTLKFEGERLSEDTIRSTRIMFVAYITIIVICTLLISVDGYSFESNFSASLTCISNIGPGFAEVGPIENFSGYSWFSKIVLSLEMLAGRLELFPMLLLFSPSTWKKNS